MSKTLAGKTIVVTRPKEQSAAFQRDLEERGAKVILFPTIEIRSVSDPAEQEALERALKNLPAYRWIIFTSVNGVDSFFESIGEQAQALNQLAKARCAVIGEKTAERLAERGVQATLCPKEYRAEGVLEEMLRMDGPALRQGARVLLARAAKARDVLPDGLREAGAKVDVVSVYETIASNVSAESLRAALAAGTIDCLTFTSSSTVTFFFEKMSGHDLNHLLKKPVFASIGPITAETLREKGFKPEIEAEPFTTAALAESISRYFEKKKV